MIPIQVDDDLAVLISRSKMNRSVSCNEREYYNKRVNDLAVVFPIRAHHDRKVMVIRASIKNVKGR